MKIIQQLLIGVPTIVLLAISAARAQSIYSTPSAFVTIAGKAGNSGAADGTNSAAQFYSPYGIAEDTHSNLYVADGFENTIRMLTPNGTNWVVTTIAGTPGASGDVDGTNGAASFDNPVGIAVDTNGNLYVGENLGSTIRKITPVGTNWVVTTIAGQPENYNFADGTNSNALFDGQLNLTVDTKGNLYVADTYNAVIRKVAPVGTNWVVTTIAGQPGQYGYADGTNSAASFGFPYGLAFDKSGNLFVSDNDGNLSGGATIRKLTPVGTNWVVTTIAGSPAVTGSADGTNSAALFNNPLSIAADIIGNLYVADYGNSTIRKVASVGTNWVVSTIAGVTGVSGSTDGTGTNALFAHPWGATVDSSGNLFVTDYGNSTVRMGLVPVVPPPVVAFRGTPTNGVAPLGVTFTNLSSNATNYVWNFGDGNILNTGSSNNVTDTYTNAGTYTVILTAYGPGGMNALTNMGYITVTSPPPVAAFSGTPTSGVAPLGVTFTNLSSNATNFVWNFGDGRILNTNSSANVTETYTNAGTYTVILTASGPGGMRAVTNTAYIVVTSSMQTVPNPTVQFVAPNTVMVSWPNTGNFILQTNGNLATPNWVNYGGPVTTNNGTNSVTITLPATGFLFFRLAYGAVQNVAPVAAFSGTPTNGVAPLVVTFTNLSSNATNYVWNFGDGHTLSTGSSTNVTETYTNAGAYTVILTAYGPGGMSSQTNSAYIVVTSSTQTVPNPTLQFIGPNTVKVSWPNTGNFILQTNGNLATPNWVNYGGPVTTSNGTNSVTITLPESGFLFFRLANGTVQNVTVPNLAIVPAGLNTIVVSWPNTGNFTLQTNADLTTTNWAVYGGTINPGGATNSATITPLRGSLFFRLKQ